MSANFMKGYAITATVNRPPAGLIDMCKDEIFGYRYSKDVNLVLYLALPGIPDNVWEPIQEDSVPLSDGRTTTRRRFPIPEPLQGLPNAIRYGLEAKEIGAIEGEGDDTYVDFAYVVTGLWGQRKKAQWLNRGHECPRDWHHTSGLFAAKGLGRVGVTNGCQLDIDQTKLKVGTDRTDLSIATVRLFHDPNVESFVETHRVPPKLRAWQFAVDGLWQRLTCGGCDSLHFVDA